MWLKNLTLYRLPENWPVRSGTLEKKLAAQPLAPCPALQMESRGWTPPRPEGEFVHQQANHWLIALGVEQKLLPGSVVKQAAEERAGKLAKKQAHPVGRKQMRDLREQVLTELMPRALARRRITHGWIDRDHSLLAVDAAADPRAELFVETLRRAEDGSQVLRIETNRSPASAMAEWLSKGDAPGKFSIDQDLELRAPDSSKATVRYSRHALEGRDIRDHLAAGKAPVRLGLTWNDRISFVLTDTLQVKRIAFLDILKREDGDYEGSNPEDGDSKIGEEEKFEIDFSLMTGELSLMLIDLVKALGGEKARQSAR
jgi:recombination associated protein RdgC